MTSLLKPLSGLYIFSIYFNYITKNIVTNSEIRAFIIMGLGLTMLTSCLFIQYFLIDRKQYIYIYIYRNRAEEDHDNRRNTECDSFNWTRSLGFHENRNCCLAHKFSLWGLYFCQFYIFQVFI